MLVTGWPSGALYEAARRIADRVPSGFEVSLLPPSVEPLVAAAHRLGGDATRSAFDGMEVVSLLDSAEIDRDLGSWELLSDRGFHANPRDLRHVADLLLERIEAATEILVLGSVVDAARHGDLLRCLAPGASLHFTESVAAAVDACVLAWASRTSDVDQAVPEAAWAKALRDPSSCATDARERYAFRSRVPFHAGRFARWFDDLRQGCVRAKGRLWLAGRPDEVLGFSRAGAVTRLFLAGRWWASVPRTAWPRCSDARRSIEAEWDARFGDREQRIAFLGPALDAARIASDLHECLLTDREIAAGFAAWRRHPDPLAPRGARFVPWSITHLS